MYLVFPKSFYIYSTDRHHMTKSMWTPASQISFQKVILVIIGIHMELVPPAITAHILLERLSTICWNITVGTCFHSATRALVRSALMLGDEAWLVVDVPIHSKGVQWGWGQCSVQASQVFPHQSWQTISVWTTLCARGIVMLEQERAFPKLLPQTWKCIIV